MIGNRLFRSRLYKVTAVLILFSLCFTGCLTMTDFALSNADPIYDKLMESMMDLPNAQVAKEGLPGMAILMASMVALSPENPKLLGLAGAVYGIWGFLIESEDMEFAMELYTVGESYGLRGVKCLDDDIKKGLEDEGKTLADFADKVDEDNMDVVFFYTFVKALHMFADMENPYVLAEAGDVFAMIERIGEVDESFFFYTPALFKAGIAAFGGPLMGFNRDDAKKMFEDTMAKMDNKMLLGYWIWARFYAVTIMDEKLFDETVEYVLNTPNNALPGGALLNAIAKIKVEELKKNKDRYF